MMIRYNDSLTLPPLKMVEREIGFKKTRKNGKSSKKIATCQNIISFDTESTSAFITKHGLITDITARDANGNYILTDAEIEESDKIGWVYIWMFCIDGTTIYGRTLDELNRMIVKMAVTYIDPLIFRNKKDKKKANPIIYVHNLAWDYYFIKNIVNFKEIFARAVNKPLKAIDAYGFEWRDSLALTNVKLALVPKIYNFADKVQKMVGDLDYKVLRTPSTQLSEAELQYCENDVVILYHLGLTMQAEYVYMQDIPLTQTGRLRPEVYEIMHNTGYDVLAQELQPRDADGYLESIQLFVGGYTHANYRHVGETVYGAHSWDITSSYPTVMVTEKFPCEKFHPVTKDLENLDYENYCYIIHLKVGMMVATTYTSTYSYSRILNPEELVDVTVDNGRVRRAENAELIMTEQDYKTLTESYDLIDVEVLEIKAAKKDYLPVDFVKMILKYYKNKTQYKDDENKKVEYVISKIYINALYGLTVTQYVTDESLYVNNKWVNVQLAPRAYIDDFKSKVATDSEKLWIDANFKAIEDKIEQELSNIKLPFYTGVWITAYARRNLFKVMLQIDSDTSDCDDVIYSDTDSIKYKGDHRAVFDAYNKDMLHKMEEMSVRIGVSEDDYAPKDKHGVRHPLGVYDYEGEYIMRTWGAKKYIAYNRAKHKIQLTVAGCSKSAIDYLKIRAGVDVKDIITEEEAVKIIDEFKLGLVIPREYSGRSVIYRVDNQGDGGYITINNEKIYAPSACVLAQCTYTLGVSEDYSELLSSLCPHNTVRYFEQEASLKNQIMEKLGYNEDITDQILQSIQQSEIKIE